jgi:hypothetical protein
MRKMRKTMMLITVAAFVCGCAAKQQQPPRISTDSVRQDCVSTAPEAAEGGSDQDDVAALEAWHKHPVLSPPNVHFQPTEANGNTGGHYYRNVPGLPPQAVLVCSFRPGCYHDVVARGGRSDEVCIDKSTCVYDNDGGKMR